MKRSKFDKMLTVKLTDEMHQAINRKAKEEGVYISEIVRSLLQRWLDKRREEMADAGVREGRPEYNAEQQSLQQQLNKMREELSAVKEKIQGKADIAPETGSIPAEDMAEYSAPLDKTESEDFSVLIDFYNLHLKSGAVYLDKATDSDMAWVERGDDFAKIPAAELRENERKRKVSSTHWSGEPKTIEDMTPASLQEEDVIIEFFDKHAPRASRFKKISQLPRKNGLVNLKPDGSPWYSLAGYEHRKGVPWFKSFDFIAFVDEYRIVENFLDLYIDGQYRDSLLFQLQRALLENREILNAIDKEGKAIKLTPDSEKKRNIDEISFSSTNVGVYFRRHSLALGWLFQRIYRDLLTIISVRRKIKRCELEECDEIFFPRGVETSKEQRYCSNLHRTRDAGRRQRRKEDSKERRMSTEDE